MSYQAAGGFGKRKWGKKNRRLACDFFSGSPFYGGFPFKITPNPALIELHTFLEVGTKEQDEDRGR
jgi:hypothetical protein